MSKSFNELPLNESPDAIIAATSTDRVPFWSRQSEIKISLPNFKL